MTYEHDGSRPGAPDIDRIGQLVKLAGRRPMPDTSQTADARAAAHAEWVRLLRRRRRGRLWAFGASAVAACLVALVAWSWLRTQRVPVPGPEVATLRTSAGTSVTIISGDGRTLCFSTMISF